MTIPLPPRKCHVTRRRISGDNGPSRNPLPSPRKKRQNERMEQFEVRSARPSDAPRIARLDVEIWRATYAGILTNQFLVGLSIHRREIGWAAVIEREPRDVLVAVDSDGLIVGFGSCGRGREKVQPAGEVFTLYVGQDWQNQGVGRQLLVSLFQRLVDQGCPSVIIWVLCANPNRFFYQRVGGTEVRRKVFTVGGSRVEASGYMWRDLPRYLETAARAEDTPEP
jgi:ribosomal protein S18 acetylase RimI-like enzyme